MTTWVPVYLSLVGSLLMAAPSSAAAPVREVLVPSQAGPVLRITGAQSSFVFGAGVGDFNGDGRGDVAVPVASTLRDGATVPSVVFGGAAGVVDARTPGDRGVVLEDSASDGGGSVGFVAAGDVDGDGSTDLLTRRFTDGARLRLVFGSRASGVRDVAVAAPMAATLLTEGPEFDTVAAGRDVNGDGRPDLVLGVPSFTAPSSGDDGAFLSGAAAAIFLTGAASQDAGPVLRNTEQGPGFLFAGVGTDENAGSQVALVPDINGDGMAEVVSGSSPSATPGASRGSKAFIAFGRPGFRTITAITALGTTSFPEPGGISVAGARSSQAGSGEIVGLDANGDGRGDVALADSSVRRRGRGVGGVWLLSGRRLFEFGGYLEERSRLVGLATAPAGDTSFGEQLTVAGDVNGDGRQELMVSSTYRTRQRKARDAAYLLYARNSDEAFAAVRGRALRLRADGGARLSLGDGGGRRRQRRPPRRSDRQRGPRRPRPARGTQAAALSRSALRLAGDAQRRATAAQESTTRPRWSLRLGASDDHRGPCGTDGGRVVADGCVVVGGTPVREVLVPSQAGPVLRITGATSMPRGMSAATDRRNLRLRADGGARLQIGTGAGDVNGDGRTDLIVSAGRNVLVLLEARKLRR